MILTDKVHKIIMHKLEIWIPGTFLLLGIFFLSVFQDWLNIQIPKLLEPHKILVVAEILCLLLCLLGTYILLSRSKSKKDMMELKTFLNKYVYSKYEIHNPFFKEASHTIDDHLSLKPFYKSFEQEKQTK